MSKIPFLMFGFSYLFMSAWGIYIISNSTKKKWIPSLATLVCILFGIVNWMIVFDVI